MLLLLHSTIQVWSTDPLELINADAEEYKKCVCLNKLLVYEIITTFLLLRKAQCKAPHELCLYN